MLIEAFSLIAASHADWGLTILGEGNLRNQLQRQIENAGLSLQVQLAGRVSNPHAWFTQADLFVLSSRYEVSAVRAVRSHGMRYAGRQL